MTSAGAKLVAQLLAVEDGDTPLPLSKLVLHYNDIDAEGYAAVGAAVRHERCGLKEIVVSTHVKESKSGSRKTVATTEHNSIKVDEVRSMLEMRHEFFGDAELMVLSELLLLNTTLTLIHLKKNAIGDDGANALGRAISAGRLPIRALRMQSNHVCAEGAQSIVEGLMLGSSPIEEISFIDNPICLSSSVVRKQKLEQELDADLKKQANASRSTPASDWAKVQLQTCQALAERTAQSVPATALRQEDFAAVLRLPRELRQDRWQDLGGLYWTHHASTPGRGSEHLHASTPGRSARAGAGASSARDQHDLPERMLLPLPRHLSSLTDEQLHQLWAW